ncbi:MAG TPA: hypothetical protein VHE30_18735 [Polyangiaceae bacterium]|nr:hypothetical protein [Polyangiaceae bacterium]
MGRVARALSFGAGIPALLLGGVARADPETKVPPAEQPIRMQYEAPEDCPDALHFFLHVRARTQRIRLAEPGEEAALVSVSLTTGDSGSAGTLEMPGSDGHPFVRHVEATTCDEVSLALSLVLALAYDPDALTSFEPAPAPAPAPPAPFQPVSPPPPLPYPPPRPPETPPPPYGLSVGAVVVARSGVTPVLTPLYGAFVDYGSSSDDGFAPRGSAALFVSGEHDTVVTNGSLRRSTTLEFFGAELAGCPVAWSPAPSVAVRPCLAFDVGRLLGVAGPEVEPRLAGSLTWLSVSALARIRWKLAGPVFVEPSAGGGFTILHENFALVGPPKTVHELPAAFYELGLGAGVHFP